MYVTVRVMHREYIGRPTIGNRKRLGTHAYGVAEYHGNRCYRVCGASDSPTKALTIADAVARELNAVVVPLPKTRKPRPNKSANVPAKKVKIKREDAKIKARVMADKQALHVRDIDTVGYCTACESKKRSHPCGKPEDATPVAEMSAWDLAFMATAKLREK